MVSKLEKQVAKDKVDLDTEETVRHICHTITPSHHRQGEESQIDGRASPSVLSVCLLLGVDELHQGTRGTTQRGEVLPRHGTHTPLSPYISVCVCVSVHLKGTHFILSVLCV